MAAARLVDVMRGNRAGFDVLAVGQGAQAQAFVLVLIDSRARHASPATYLTDSDRAAV